MTNASRDPLPPDEVEHPESEGVYDKCMLHDADRIRTQLQQLIDKRCMLTASGAGGAISMLTAPLAIEGAMLWIDVPPSDAVLRGLLACERLSFDGAIDRVTLRFTSGPATLASHGGRPALRIPVPIQLLYLQRRELMRREPPAGTLNCFVPGRGKATGIATTIRDIGGGGLAVLAPDEALSLTLGDVLPGCVIELPDFGPVEVTLQVRHLRTVTQLGKSVRQAGCEFVDLPAAAQSKLFRYLMQLDREQLARKRDRAAD